MPRDKARAQSRSRSPMRRSPPRRWDNSPRRSGRHNDSPKHDSYGRHTYNDSRRPRDESLRRKDARSLSPSGRSRAISGDKLKRSKSRSRSPASKKRRRSHSVEKDKDGDRRKDRSRRRSHSRSRSREKDGKRRRERGRSASSSSEGSMSRRRERRKDRESKRSKSKERRKEKKREKKEKKKLASGSSVPQWGKYGIISEADIFLKGPEFYTWLVEERKINPETISKDQNKKEFAKYVEDFNTATLPHEKYYHMEAYERRMSALRQGEFIPPPDDSYDPQADMKAISGAHKKKVVEHESYLSKDQLQELRKVQHERIEAAKMRLLGMDVKQNMGVRMDGTVFDD